MKKRISLTMIVGNVESYALRCLESFAPIADEIVMVRAIGRQEPDATMDIARACAERHGISFVAGEYLNAAGHEDWMHVDSFAAARQMSFDLATGDWCFWCDSDDVLKSGAELIREHAEHDVPVFIYPYEIFGRGVTVPRERMIRRDAGGCWKFPVHECYTFPEQVEGGTDERVVVQHLPHTTKSGSMERNLRILESIADDDMTPGLLYHLHCEQRGAGRINDAIESAKKALSHPGLGRPEKYELFLNMASMCQNPQVSHAYLLQAYATDPCRREALGLLAATAIDSGRPEESLAFARQMMATPRPHDWSWNDRAQAYGWIGTDIMQQSLRANGKMDDADKLRVQCLDDAGGPRISLLHATRGRARMASGARKMWHDLAENPGRIEHIFAIDDDDEASFPLRRFHHVSVPGDGGCVAAWNAAAAIATGDVLIQLSDDWMPPAKWDTLILSRMGDLTIPKVLAVSDGIRKDKLLCMAILTRARYQDQGYLFHPGFKSVYSDNWFTHCAIRDACILPAYDLTFEHLHPVAGKGVMDATYEASNARERYADGLALFEKLKEAMPSAMSATGTSWIDSARCIMEPKVHAVAPSHPVLSILVPAIPSRGERSRKLMEKLLSQAEGKPVEVLSLCDNKQRSVGAKRQALQDIARGEYIAFVDDDDDVSDDYIASILEAAKRSPDVITFRQMATINGVSGTIDFSIAHDRDEQWTAGGMAKRRPWHVCAWRRSLVRDCRFADCNFGEDVAWVNQAAPLAKSSVHIDRVLHHYRHGEWSEAPPPGTA